MSKLLVKAGAVWQLLLWTGVSPNRFQLNTPQPDPLWEHRLPTTSASDCSVHYMSKAQVILELQICKDFSTKRAN